MKISVSAAVFLLAASNAFASVSGAASPNSNPAFVVMPQHRTTRRVVPPLLRQQQQKQQQHRSPVSRLFLSSFPIDSTVVSVPHPRGEPPRENRNSSSSTSSSRYYENPQGIAIGQQQQQVMEKPPSSPSSSSSSPSLNPMIVMSVGTVMLLAGIAMTATSTPSVAVHDESTTPTTTVLSEHDRRVQQDMFDYELQEQTMAADVMSGGFYY